MNRKAENSILFWDILKISGISENDMLVKSRKSNIIKNRAIVCCVMYDMNVRITDIAEFVGIDRSTIYNLLKKKLEFEHEISDIEDKLWQKKSGGKYL